MGVVPATGALRRQGAVPGDDIWVSGVIGRAGLGLLVRQAQREGRWTAPDAALLADCIDALECPVPRLALGKALAGLASACIDVSDGLLQDLGHVLTASGVGALLDIDAIPVSAWAPWQKGVSSACADAARLRSFALSAGDDYELCFAAPASRRDEVLAASQRAGVVVTRIGSVMTGSGIVDAGTGQRLQGEGYRHFVGSEGKNEG
jgi:thiamine-monophosphate kinase